MRLSLTITAMISRSNCFASAMYWFSPAIFTISKAAGHLVLSLLTKPDVFREGVSRLHSDLVEAFGLVGA